MKVNRERLDEEVMSSATVSGGAGLELQRRVMTTVFFFFFSRLIFLFPITSGLATRCGKDSSFSIHLIS